MTVKFEDVLREINGFGKYQKTRYVLICLAALLPSIATYINSFTAALPEFKCSNHGGNEFSSLKKPINLNCVYHSNGTLQKCTSWTFEKKYFQSTLTEEWNMVCDRSIFRSKVQSIYFIGYLVGSLVLGNLSDRYGRRPVMLLSFCLMLFGFFGSTFGPQKIFGFTISYILYAISRFLIACGTRGINETGYVLALELVGTKMRTYAGIGFENFFSFGQLILVLIAYFVRDWRQLSLTFTVFIIPFLSYFLLG
ncbi:organic cation transporter isoform X1 [Brachionus plicatilis]|uniref:Organic cation transporter isoform X1 n=1 Tax=Brachionus plicatilis TaxID=10195 RepID=A0A3M7R828_BRAPC|nr:organic cation transporter isoform X1 [Brachionus plicatilis]